MEFKVETNQEYDRLQKAINSLGDAEARVGWFENDVYDNKYQTPVATVAIIQEKGATIHTHHFEKFQEDAKNKSKSATQRHARKYKNVSGDFSQVVIIPPRPFIGPALKKNNSKFADQMEKSSSQVLDGSKSLFKAFSELALSVRSAIQDEIKSVSSPPLSEATIKNRLSKLKDKQMTSSLSKPLIDSGKLFRSVSYKVSTS